MFDFTTNIRELEPFVKKWAPIRMKIRKKFNMSLKDSPSVHFASKLLAKMVVDKADGDTVIKEAFEETVSMSDCKDVDTLYLCAQRMVDLCLVLDYGPAGAWLGLFCEEVLKKYEDAQYWYNKAASFGNGIGMYRVGMLYLNKKVPLPRQTSLKRCFTDALAKGVPQAKEILEQYF